MGTVTHIRYYIETNQHIYHVQHMGGHGVIDKNIYDQHYTILTKRTNILGDISKYKNKRQTKSKERDKNR